ncbi:MAG: hypothetical protein ACFFC7_13065 [Candidatus Hermodarchaeota archaeon]
MLSIGNYRRNKEIKRPKWARFFNPVQYRCFLRLIRAYSTERRVKMEIDINWGECTVYDTKTQIGFLLHELGKKCKKYPLHFWKDIITDYMDQNLALIQSLKIVCPECQSPV